MSASSIEWTDETWNPVRGCSRVSEGCRNCYAERMAARNLPEMRSPTTGKPFAVRGADGPHWTGSVELISEKLAEPLHWRKPRRVFVNSMSDLFHEGLPDDAIDRVFAVMALAPQHTFQILTKRPERMRDYFTKGVANRIERVMVNGYSWTPYDVDRVRAMPLPNVWLGTSVEDQATADARIPLLMETPAAKRFISLEPQLARVDLARGKDAWLACHTLMNCDATHLDWVIVGGESGHGARPFDVAWARETVRDCRAAGVACFVKQMGAHVLNGVQPGREAEWLNLPSWPGRPGEPTFDARGRVYLASKKGGDMSEWPEDLRVREFPK